MTESILDERTRLIANALLIAGHKCTTFGSTKLLKYLYFSDTLHYNIFGESIFHTAYNKANYGPVISEAYPIVTATNEYFTVIQQNEDGIPRKCIPQKNPDLSLFDDKKQTIFAGVINAIQPFSANTVSNVTHDIDIWENGRHTICETDLYLTENDRKVINRINLSYNPFQTEAARTISTLTPENTIEQLDSLLKKYPYTDIPEIENAYLAWDTTVRTCIHTKHPELLDTLRGKGNCMTSAASFRQDAHTPEMVRLETYEDTFNEISTLLSREKQLTPGIIETNIANAVLSDIRTEYESCRR